MNQILIRDVVKCGLAVSLSLIVCGCGARSPLPVFTQAQTSDISIASTQPGLTPFISSFRFVGNSLSDVVSVAFTILPQAASVSQPLNVTWSMAALFNRGYAQGDSISLPVFGLYAGYQNLVTFDLTFNDGSVQTLPYSILTAQYSDPAAVYLTPTILQGRLPGSNLGFNFFLMKSAAGAPAIADTDGQLRWTVPIAAGQSIYFADGQFIYGSNPASLNLLQFDGTQVVLPTNLPQPLLQLFHHNIDPGPKGLLAEFTGTDSLGSSIEDIVAEIAPFSQEPPFQTFNMATILRSYMLDSGDDPTNFVRPGIDWFHLNASTYDPTDNSVILSSRENFLIKLDYSTHDIVWIFGDPTKYWYTFPSLKVKALLLDGAGLYPIGQHGVSITSDGDIMVFNDGYGSLNPAPGGSAGVTRTYSAVSAYSVNGSAMTAHEEWNFDYGQSIYSPICSSSYEAPGKTYLVDFATADNNTKARLIGLDSDHNVAFDFEYPSAYPCGTAWNAIPVALENLQIE